MLHLNVFFLFEEGNSWKPGDFVGHEYVFWLAVNDTYGAVDKALRDFVNCGF